MRFLDPVLKRWPLFAFVVSAAILAIAHAFQTFGHLEPCHLCLKQREAYWAALTVSAIALVVAVVRPHAPGPRIASLVLAAVFAYGVYIAAWQAGAEWKWWPAPATCASAGAGQISLSDLQALMGGAAAPPPACDKAAWIFLGLSMAGWNCLISLALVGFSLAAALHKEKSA